jgi:hypothetical protein
MDRARPPSERTARPHVLEAGTPAAFHCLLSAARASLPPTQIGRSRAASFRLVPSSPVPQELRPRLRHLSGDDLAVLLTLAAATSGPQRLGLLAPSTEWQVALFAAVDGVNWALQGRQLAGAWGKDATLALRASAMGRRCSCLGGASAGWFGLGGRHPWLVWRVKGLCFCAVRHAGCLHAVVELGLRPPPAWLARQLTALQPSLPSLPNASLAQLGALLPQLPLQPQQAQPQQQPAVELPAWRAALSSLPQLTGAGEAGAGSRAGGWLAGWLAEYRAAVWERRGGKDAMSPAELLAAVLGVDTVRA